MTPERAKELLPIITAFSEGKTIQYRNPPGVANWETYIDPSFNNDSGKYRIKPEPKYRPWKMEEVPVGAVVKNHNGSRILILGCRTNGMISFPFDGNYTTEEVFRKCTMLDGTPCGVLE